MRQLGAGAVLCADDKVVLATIGGSPTKPGEVAMLAVETVDQLLSAEPSHWETLRKSSNVKVGVSLLKWLDSLSNPPVHHCTSIAHIIS